MAELASGPHATTDPEGRGRRQDRPQRAEAAFDPLPFDTDAARAYGRIFAAATATGRKARGARAVDLLIAATALAAGLPLYTRNGDDLLARLRLGAWSATPRCHGAVPASGLPANTLLVWARNRTCGVQDPAQKNLKLKRILMD